jgi:hypothetical protein
MTIHIYNIVIDCADPRRLADFWMRALDYQQAFATPQEIGIESSDDPDDRLPALVFVRVPEPKQAKNRLHLDLNPSDQDAEVQRLVALGARRADVGQADVSWVVLADPEGNEFCVLPPR